MEAKREDRGYNSLIRGIYLSEPRVGHKGWYKGIMGEE